MDSEVLFPRPTAVFISGDDRTLLKWVAYALAVRPGREYYWTDLRIRGEAADAEDPLTRHLVPPDHLSVVAANELQPDEGAAARVHAATGGVLRADEAPESLRRVAEFLRLPSHTQELLARVPSGRVPTVLVLSNAHRVVALYPTGTVGPVVRAIVESGAVLVVTFADAPPEGRHAFDTVLAIEGRGTKGWRNAILRVEKGAAEGSFRPGFFGRLETVPAVASVLAATLG